MDVSHVKNLGTTQKALLAFFVGRKDFCYTIDELATAMDLSKPVVRKACRRLFKRGLLMRTAGYRSHMYRLTLNELPREVGSVS